MKICTNCKSIFSDPINWSCPACGFLPELKNGFPSFANPESGDGFDPDAFASLAELESRNFWFVSRNQLIVWGLQKFFPGMGDFLEVGCGTGFVLSGVARAFPEARLAGSEYFSEALPYASRRVPRAAFCQADARALPYENEFDVIGSFDVLEHIQEDVDVLKMFYRALIPGGGLILTVPQHQWLWSQSDEESFHVRRYARRELVDKVQAAGFDIEYITSFVSFLLPLMFASRWLKKHPTRDRDHTEIRIHPILNAVFRTVMSLERLLIAFGVRLPVGGSLLLVGRKRGSE